VRHHHDGRDQGERHQVREVGAAFEHVGEGRGSDARARRGDQERVPDSHGAPSRSVDPSLRRGRCDDAERSLRSEYRP